MNEWNFHGHIAVPLEHYGKTLIGETFYTADEIEHGEFVDAMLEVLSAEYGGLEAVNEFVKVSSIYASLPANRIRQKAAVEIFDDFKRLIKNKSFGG